jgi:hypothetical protein
VATSSIRTGYASSWLLSFSYFDVYTSPRVGMLTIVDDATRMVLAGVICASLQEKQCIRQLTKLTRQHGGPSKLVLDETVQTTIALLRWCTENGIELTYAPAR